MLRLDPGDMRIRNTRTFTVWEGGGEYNVARGLRKCFGLTTAVVTAFPENDIARLVEDFVLQGGVDTSLIRWVPFDGIGTSARVGLNFTERGFGVRGALGVSDRGHSAASLQSSNGRGLGFIRAAQPSPNSSKRSKPRGAIPGGARYDAANVV